MSLPKVIVNSNANANANTNANTNANANANAQRNAHANLKVVRWKESVGKQCTRGQVVKAILRFRHNDGTCVGTPNKKTKEHKASKSMVQE